jgi:hypothetical protein
MDSRSLIRWSIPPLTTKVGLNSPQYLINSSHHHRVNPFMQSEDESVSGIVVGVVHSAYRVDLSRLDSGALQMVSEPTFVATGACGLGV